LFISYGISDGIMLLHITLLIEVLVYMFKYNTLLVKVVAMET